jgi:hypothetical protein
MRTFFEVLQETGLPVAYSHFDKPQKPPFMVYMANGQDQFRADNEPYLVANTYRAEYYFRTKNETEEAAIEKTLTDNGYLYEKSEDIYIDSEKMFVVYYYVERKGYKNV